MTSPLSRSNVEQLARRPEDLELASVDQALARLDFDDATARLLARGLAGLTVPACHVGRVFPRLHGHMAAATLAGIADAGIGAELVALSERDEFPPDDLGWTMRALALYTAWRLDGDRVRAAAMDQARAYALLHRQSPTSRQSVAILRILADEARDEALGAHLPETNGYVPIEVLAVQGCLALSREERVHVALTTLDPSPLQMQVARMAIEHNQSTHARNAPCWCGSGKKFKRCHGVTSDAAVAGLWTSPAASTLRRSVASLQPMDVMTMPLPELADLVARRRSMTDTILATAMDRLLKYRAWEQLDLLFEEFDRRTSLDVETRDHARFTLFERASAGRQFERARRYATGFRTEALRRFMPVYDVSLALRERAAGAFDELTRFAEVALRDETGALAQNLAPTLLLEAPALGLLFIRGWLDATRPAETRRLLNLAEVARARLGLPLEDPAWERFASLQTLEELRAEAAGARARAEAAEGEVAGLRRELQQAAKQARQHEERARELEIELGRISAMSPAPSPTETEMRAAKNRIEELQALLRERNDERAELRRRLATLESASEPSTRSADVPEVSDDLEADADKAEVRPRIPNWSRRAVESMSALPASVAREALLTAGELSAGEPGAWRSVKRPKGVERALLMVRIGIHYRLLFRISHAEMEVVDVVSRESLLLTLKRLA